MSSSPRILALSDGSELPRALAAELGTSAVLLVANTLDDALRAVAGQPPAAALVPDRLQTGATGRTLAAELERRFPGLPVVLLTAAPEGSDATLALQLGEIADVVPVPWRPAQLRHAIARAIELATVRHERDQLRDQLRDSQRRPPRPAARTKLEDMVDSMADGLILTELNKNEVTINRAARLMLGIQADVVVTTEFLKDRLGFYPFDLVVATAGANPTPLREEVRVGDQVLHSIVSPVKDADDTLAGVVVALRDMTEARDTARRQSEFISLVSHELRTPLTSITGALDIVLSDYAGHLTDKQRRYLQMARESCTRLNMTVDDLLDVARSDTGRMPMNFTPLDLDALGRAVVDRYRQAAAAKQVEFTVRSEQSIRIVGDHDRLTQVLNNLVSNAIKFTPLRGRIEVEIFGPSVAANHVGVSVFNNGDPIPEEDRERIFDKFEQLNASRHVGGTGLGLAISRSIIEAHAGRIWAESNLAGTRFVFTLPAAPAVVETDSLPSMEPQPPSSQGDGGATVLVLETDPHATYILKGLLMASGHEVLVSGDADTALTLARTRHPNLMIVDLSGPNEDALSLVEIFEHDPDTRKTAVMVIGSEGDREAALRAGANEFLPKPIDPDAFRETGARLIAEAGRTRAPRVLVVDDEPMIRTICRDVLEAAGYQVMDAANGNTAIAVARRHKPDLMLVDVMMPDIDGFQTAEKFRADPATSLTPVIFLSARGETADKVRAFRIGAEDYVVKPFDAAELVARVAKALERHSRELGASPTTQLPGGDAIEAEVERRLAHGGPHAYCYLDLDNLKAFNDYYGYAKADGVIRQTGDLIRDLVGREGSPGDFIGHIAGDDFVFITSNDRVDRVCAAIIETFGRLVPLYYNKSDRERGYIETKDRYGVMRRFPIMSVSIAAVTTTSSAHTFSELAAAAAVGKKLAKAAPGSAYVRDGHVLIGEADAPPSAAGTA